LVQSESYAVTVCVLIQRGDRWLLVVRAPDVAYAPNMIGMIGGHVDVTRPLADVLEATARREVAEEVGLDLSAVALRYLESEFFITDRGERQITVTFTASAFTEAEPYINAPDELVEVGWWTLDDLEGDPRCPSWLPRLIRRAGRAR
jgi:8-oxo-dGTP diphosphatase